MNEKRSNWILFCEVRNKTQDEVLDIINEMSGMRKTSYFSMMEGDQDISLIDRRRIARAIREVLNHPHCSMNELEQVKMCKELGFTLNDQQLRILGEQGD